MDRGRGKAPVGTNGADCSVVVRQDGGTAWMPEKAGAEPAKGRGTDGGRGGKRDLEGMARP